jgi:hypothetical protein
LAEAILYEEYSIAGVRAGALVTVSKGYGHLSSLNNKVIQKALAEPQISENNT